ncbi:phospholipase D-like domain-containing protein [Yersinia enterocolitica]
MNAKYSIMHNIFFLIDSKSHKIASFNYSAAAEARNAENIFIIHCVDDVTASYQQEFTRLWEGSVAAP